MKLKKSIKNGVQYYTALLFIRFFRLIPRKTGIFITRILALIAYVVLRKHRHNTIRHLTIAFGNEKTEQEIHDLARRVFVHFATVFVDVIRIPLFLKDGIDRYVRVENIHYLQEALDRGKGVILLTGHFGNWELMGAWMSAHGYPIAAIAAALTNPGLNRLIVDLRNQAGYINIPRGNAVAEISKTLKSGNILGILMDQDTRLRGVFVDFFGKKANTPSGPLQIARKYGASIVPMFMHLESDLTYHLECFKPLVLAETGDKNQDILADALQCNTIYEQVIRRHPEQWAWMHRRWKRQS